MSNLGEQFLHQKNPMLHTEAPVEHEMKRKRVAGEKVSSKPADKLAAWLKVLERTHTGHHEDSRVMAKIRGYYHDLFIEPYREKLATAAAKVEERAARSLGVDAHYEGEIMDQRGDIAVEDLEKSLDQWIDYLTNPEESYPMWFRYYVFTNVIQLSDFNKDMERFPKRTKDTVRLFPEIDRGALAYIEDIIEASGDEAKLKTLIAAQRESGTPESEILTKAKAKNFANRSFGEQYLEGIKQKGEITPEMRAETRGQWVKYNKGENALELWKSLQHKGTAWCTKGFATATSQLKGGDFYIYYTLDKNGVPTIPRIAIRMDGDTSTSSGQVIGEVRGTADSDQNLEGNMVEIAEKKMSELPGKEEYLKKSADMKHLTAIENKVAKKQELTKDDLMFLYEINGKIQGFGYQEDPRIKELRSQRNPEEDMLVVFECSKNQIARNITDITKDTKAYVGKLVPGIFQTVPATVEHIYTTFPEGRIERISIEIGGLTKEQLKRAITDKKDDQGRNYQMGDPAKKMIDSPDFVVSKKTEKIDAIRLKVGDLGFTEEPTTDELYARGKELGLELCPAEVGPYLRLRYEDIFKREQPVNEWLCVAMKQIAASGSPYVFYVSRSDDGCWLRGSWAFPADPWSLDGDFVFRFGK